MAELTVRSGKDEEGRTIAADIGEAGVHIFVDRDYFDRRAEVRAHFKLEDADIAKLQLSARREFLLRRTMDDLAFVNSQGTAGQGGDSPKFYKAMAAARNLCQRNMEDILYSEADDSEVGPICLDRLSMVEKLPQATFRKDNSNILKSFTVQGPMQQQMGQPTMMPVQQLTANSPKPERTSGEYAGRNPTQK